MTGILWGLKRLQGCHGKDVAPNLTSYLPSLTNLDTEFPKLLNETCSGLPPFDSFKERIVHASQSDKFNFYSAAKQAWKHQGNVSRALCAIHALDYACFDDIPVPTLCQEVYSKSLFQHKVLHAMRIGKQMTLDPCGIGNFP